MLKSDVDVVLKTSNWALLGFGYGLLIGGYPFEAFCIFLLALLISTIILVRRR